MNQDLHKIQCTKYDYHIFVEFLSSVCHCYTLNWLIICTVTVTSGRSTEDRVQRSTEDRVQRSTEDRVQISTVLIRLDRYVLLATKYCFPCPVKNPRKLKVKQLTNYPRSEDVTTAIEKNPGYVLPATVFFCSGSTSIQSRSILSC